MLEHNKHNSDEDTKSQTDQKLVGAVARKGDA
jgi:hypothetical protein